MRFLLHRGSSFIAAGGGSGEGARGGGRGCLSGSLEACASGACPVASGREVARLRRPGVAAVSEVREGGARARQGVHGAVGEGPGGAASASRETRRRAVRGREMTRKIYENPPGKFFPITDRSLSGPFFFLSLFQNSSRVR